MTRPFSTRARDPLKLVLITLFRRPGPSVQKINFNLGTKSADEVLNQPTDHSTDLSFSSPLSPLSVVSSGPLDGSEWKREREKDLAWRGNSYFLKAGHDLGRSKPNVARASKLMHDTRLEPLSSSGNPLHSKRDNQKRTMGHGDHPTVLQRTQGI